MAPLITTVLRSLVVAILPYVVHGTNSTFYNPILPGFHPDPSCTFVPEWNETFFCASSSFNAFPGIPVHASKDLQNWKLIGNVLNREEQLPTLAYTNSSTSGIWAPTIRYNNGTFWLVTTLVFDDTRPANDSSRWDNIIFKSTNPYDPSSWSNAVHFPFFGYDTSPFWDEDGASYIVGSHYWKIYEALELATVNLDTGEVGDWQILWNGTGSSAPEGPHLYAKDGRYYLLDAEGGTGLGHMVNMARSRNLTGPYEGAPANPLLTAANTTSYFQTVGHADLFQDAQGNWRGVALSTRSGPSFVNYPMGRETVMTAVTWEEDEFPVWTNISGKMSVWELPPVDKDIPGPGPFISEGDDYQFPPGSSIPAHFTYWRYPNTSSFTISPPEDHPNTLKLLPSTLNLTALNGNYAAGGQTFIGRRQQETLFTYRVTLDYQPTALDEEAGVTAFLTQNHHLDLSLALLPANQSTQAFPGTNTTNTTTNTTTALIPQIRYRGISTKTVPDPIVAPLPSEWVGRPLTFEIKAANMTHFSFSVGPAGAESEMQTVLYAANSALSYGFTGTFVGVYATNNGGSGTTPAYFSDWKYIPQGQYIN
ncbi:family 43 glycoside hydrolase [Cryphonectria parasitica EP155]|uniref:Family 43 glycoside hydrolase n=1 Tax=Cryphonectria parasitica (strain ATCC 38755 / EP155) TaxID=660469 RepID=A0A9P5CK96_CRYP1|nr:family 43 glycoside hydrolase [Cryphonectria parasitica EP155]KAF3762049.1 family 43 glycoside hydrolase [Cryphonectria parasitica EP155]